ncbi:MAG: hypothetical protein D6689_03675 [Deltaproteobacteria bacterium]|nr:MAG: hypothetical protein D6689_03675 [Deltaproteobacteria bacterium]
MAGAVAEPVAGGLINRTYRVVAGDRPIVLQRLHPVFRAEVNDDIDAVTEHLAHKGVYTPRLVRTRDGATSLAVDGAIWRALTYVDGATHHRCPGAAHAEAGFAAIARFHRALADFGAPLRSARPGVHDTAAHLARLRAVAGDRPLARDILAAAADLPVLAPAPRRLAHGDLKISNVLFAREAPPRALCLIDLDTVGRQTMAYELGDALRSWCNPHGEDVSAPEIDEELVARALRGYADAAGALLTPIERADLIAGLETVCVELAARFCVDVVEDRYFGWDPARFASRREHNEVRARGQLALAHSVRRRRAALRALVDRAFAR